MHVRKLRSIAGRIQKYRCWYCEFPIWENDQAAFAKMHGLTFDQASRFKCTAEHLVARSDGGPDTPKNIVAACLFCNRTRHKTPQPFMPIYFFDYRYNGDVVRNDIGTPMDSFEEAKAEAVRVLADLAKDELQGRCDVECPSKSVTGRCLSCRS